MNSEDFLRSRKCGNNIFWLNFFDRTHQDLQNRPDFFRIFSNKIVFETVFDMAFLEDEPFTDIKKIPTFYQNHIRFVYPHGLEIQLNSFPCWDTRNTFQRFRRDRRIHWKKMTIIGDMIPLVIIGTFMRIFFGWRRP